MSPVKFDDDDDDFQSLVPVSFLTQGTNRSKAVKSSFQKTGSSQSSPRPRPLKSCNRATKRQKRIEKEFTGKENKLIIEDKSNGVDLGGDGPEAEIRLGSDEICSVEFVDSSLDCNRGSEIEKSVLSNTVESRLFSVTAEENCSLISIVEGSLDFNSSVCAVDLESGKHELRDEVRRLSLEADEGCSLGFVESSLDFNASICESDVEPEKKPLKCKRSYLLNSIESRLLNSTSDCKLKVPGGKFDDGGFEEFEPGTQFNELLRLCSDEDHVESSVGAASIWDIQEVNDVDVDDLVCCPVCGCDLSELNEEMRLVHTNECLDKVEKENVAQPSCDEDAVDDKGEEVVDGACVDNHRDKVDVSPVLDWLRSLGLEKYGEVFIQEEIDWHTLQWLTEEDLLSIGVTTLGPRKKILHALSELKRGTWHMSGINTRENGSSGTETEINAESSKTVSDIQNKLITDYFPAPDAHRILNVTTSSGLPAQQRTTSKQVALPRKAPTSQKKCNSVKDHNKKGKVKDVPLWCTIPGTPFRVDAFRYLRRDCAHWFLTHFHIDHYQGLTRSFCHGKIYCSLITARLVNLKIGVPFDRIEIIPLNQTITIAGTEVLCLDANHCPGSIIILFKPPNGKVVLHTGDFRLNEGMINLPALQSYPIHTLILDTTYCDPQYDFPKQEAVIQFVIEAIQAEDFNPKTLFLIGSYTIGKERLFLEVARALHKKVYVNAAKLRLLECLGLSAQDMGWFTLNEHESQIHVVPIWTLASVKRLKQISKQYMGRFDLIVAFSPTGWTFGKGKNKSPGKRWKQGTLIRYEVPYSEHSSFTELKEFVKFVSPVNIIPSVNNHGPESAAQMISLLSS